MNVINGLPAHILIVHFVVVVVPLAALLTVLSAVWPAARQRLGVSTPIVALLALISVPVATNAGEWLQRRVFAGELVRTHVRLGGELQPFVLGLFVVAVAAWGLPYWAARSGGHVRQHLDALWVRLVMGALAVGLTAVSVVQVVRIGESGSKAAWTGNVCAEPRVDNDCPNNTFLG